MTENNIPPWMYATNWHDLLMGLGGVVVECKLVKCDNLQVQPRCDNIPPCPWSTKINIGDKDE
jgi:hypothetical protein